MSAHASHYSPDSFNVEGAENWQELHRASDATHAARVGVSDFCGAWVALFSQIEREHAAKLEAESARMRARLDKPGETVEQILAKVRNAYMALIGAACKADKHRPRLRRFEASAWQLEIARRGTFYDFATMPKEDADRVRRNLARYWRAAWSYVFMFQRVTGLPLVERDARTFEANAREHVAASYVDRLSDLLAAIIADKRRRRAPRFRVGRFELAARSVLADFRRECEHECSKREDAEGRPCQRPHTFAHHHDKEPKGTPGRGAGVERPAGLPGAKGRAKVISFDRGKKRLLEAVEIMEARAERGLLTPEQAEEFLTMLAPVVRIAERMRRQSSDEDGVSSEDFAREPETLCQDCLRPQPVITPDPEREGDTVCGACGGETCGGPCCLETLRLLRAGERRADRLDLHKGVRLAGWSETGGAEFVAAAQVEGCDFPAKNDDFSEAPADNFIRLEPATPADFLAAFYPDPYEPLRLRFLAPRGVPADAKGFPLEAQFSTRKEGVTRDELEGDGPLVEHLRSLNQTRGAYFVVNAGGDKAAEIERVNAFFAEMDTGTLAEQHAKFDACPLPPSIRVETLKSVHAYWLAAPGAALEEFDEIQPRLIHYFKSDPKIKDRSRVMRLPFFNHVAYNAGLLSYKLVGVSHFDPWRRFTAADMRTAFPPAPDAKPKREPRRATLGELTPGTFGAWKRELGQRIMSHESSRRNGQGKWDCRGVCHNGKGTTGLFYDPSENFVCCNAEPRCDLNRIAEAFGLAPYRGDAA